MHAWTAEPRQMPQRKAKVSFFTTSLVVIHHFCNHTQPPRRLIGIQAWHLLRKFYPHGPVYPAGGSKAAIECPLCNILTDEAKQSASQEREKEISRRAELIPELLLSLYSRKSGVPTELLVHRRAMYTEWDDARQAVARDAVPTMAVGVGARTDGRSMEDRAAHHTSALTLAMGRATLLSSSCSSVGIMDKIEATSPKEGKEGNEFKEGSESPAAAGWGRPPLPRTPSFTVSNSPFERHRHNSLTSCSSTNSLDGYSSGSDLEECNRFLEIYEHSQPASSAHTSHDALPLALGAWKPPSELRYHHPLLPGIYHLVPREWLKRWRRFSKDPSSTIPLLDCTSLLCHSHGLFVIPPHLEVSRLRQTPAAPLCSSMPSPL